MKNAEIRLESTPEIRLEATPGEHEAPTNDSVDQALDQNIHLDTDGAGTPAISLSAPDSPRSSNSSAPTTLLRSRSYSASGAHPRHASALLRLLYVHSTLNPANRSPQIASLLVPLYSALIEEIEPEDASHVEADAFWLFEAMVGEFSELEDPEGANVWMRKMSEEIKSADTELAEDLVRTWSLDIQHCLIFRDHSNTRAWILYSHIIHSESERKRRNFETNGHFSRWLTTLLTHTLPLSDVLTVWDAIFSRPMRGRNSNPKLDCLIDVCTSMMLCIRSPLVRYVDQFLV